MTHARTIWALKHRPQQEQWRIQRDAEDAAVSRSARTNFFERLYLGYLGETADHNRMPFGVIGRPGPGMRQVVGFGIGPQEGVLSGANLGRAIVTSGDFMAYVYTFAATRPSSQITLGLL